MEEKNIVNRMIEFQEARGLTDLQFAKSLDIHLESWRRNKRTEVIDARVLLRALFAYPELKELFLADATDRMPHRRRYNKRESLFRRLINKICSAIQDTANPR